MIASFFCRRVQGKQFVDEIEIEFGGAPIVFSGEDLRNLSADNGMEPEAV
jgi:hypothetical protein